MISNFVGSEIKELYIELKTVLRYGENWKLYSQLVAREGGFNEDAIVVNFVRLEQISGKIIPINVFSTSWEYNLPDVKNITRIYRPLTRIGQSKSKRLSVSNNISNQQYIEKLTEEEFSYIKRNWRSLRSVEIESGIGSLIMMPILPIEVKEWILMSGIGGPDPREFSNMLTDKVKSVLSE